VLVIRKTEVFSRWLDGLREVILLLAGGKKKTQNRDIETALRLKQNL